MDKNSLILLGMILSMGQVALSLIAIFNNFRIDIKLMVITINCLTIMYLQYPLYLEMKKARRTNQDNKLKEKALENIRWQRELEN